MTISMEKIDELRKRTNCSYEEAKQLLEKHNGDILEAIVDFEKAHGFKSEKTETNTFWEKLKHLFKKGFNTRFVIENNKETIINISINFLILLAIISIHSVIIGAILALIVGYKFRIAKTSGNDIEVDKIINDVTSKVKKSVNEITKDMSEEKNNRQDSDYNEVTIE